MFIPAFFTNISGKIKLDTFSFLLKGLSSDLFMLPLIIQPPKIYQDSVLFLDFENTFNTLGRSFIQKTCRHFNFGSTINNWIKIFIRALTELYFKQWLVQWLLPTRKRGKTRLPSFAIFIHSLCGNSSAGNKKK